MIIKYRIFIFFILALLFFGVQNAYAVVPKAQFPHTSSTLQPPPPNIKKGIVTNTDVPESGQSPLYGNNPGAGAPLQSIVMKTTTAPFNYFWPAGGLALLVVAGLFGWWIYKKTDGN